MKKSSIWVSLACALFVFSAVEVTVLSTQHLKVNADAVDQTNIAPDQFDQFTSPYVLAGRSRAFAVLNAFRKQQGVKPAKMTAKLNKIAQLRAQNQLQEYIKHNRLVHYNSKGRLFAGMIGAKLHYYGNYWDAASHISENLAAYAVTGSDVDFDTPEVAASNLTQQFIDEGPGPDNEAHGHYMTMKRAANRQVGIGIAAQKIGDTFYYVIAQDFSDQKR